MRIGIDAFNLSFPFCGTGQVTTHLLSEMRKWEGCELYLYLAQDAKQALPPNCHQRVLPLKHDGLMAKKWWEARQIPAAARRDRCDAFISLYQSAAVMPRGFPHVMVVHDIIYALFPHYWNRLHKRLALWASLRGIRRAPHCIAVSHHTKQDMVQHLGMRSERISVAHVAADPRFATVLGSEEMERVLHKYGLAKGYVYHGGGLDPRKNASGLVEAYALLVKESASGKFILPRLVISGSGAAAADVMAVACRRGVSDRIAMLGQVPQADLPALYKGASAFAFPSKYEGFGLPVLEAMHQGVPVVTANTSSLPEVGGDAVLYCNPERPVEIANAILSLLTDPALSETLGQRGMQRAATFRWETLAQELWGSLKRLQVEMHRVQSN